MVCLPVGLICLNWSPTFGFVYQNCAVFPFMGCCVYNYHYNVIYQRLFSYLGDFRGIYGSVCKTLKILLLIVLTLGSTKFDTVKGIAIILGGFVAAKLNTGKSISSMLKWQPMKYFYASWSIATVSWYWLTVIKIQANGIWYIEIDSSLSDEIYIHMFFYKRKFCEISHAEIWHAIAWTLTERTIPKRDPLGAS